MLVDHDLLAELSVAVGDGHVVHDRVVGSGGPVDDHRAAMADREGMNGVVKGVAMVDNEVADGVMDDDLAMNHDVTVHDHVTVHDAVVMNRRRGSRASGGSGWNRERDRRRPQTDQQQTRKQTSHGSLPPPLVAPPRLMPAAVSILSGRGRANPR
jgi:hypothetical protein